MKSIFIVGNGRSGTTLMSSCFGNHSSVFQFPELHYYEGLIDNVSNSISKSNAELLLSKLYWRQREEYLSELNSEKYFAEAKEVLKDWPNLVNPNLLYMYFLKLETVLHKKCIACDQTPRNLFYADDILKNNPQAYIINMVRDPRSILASQKNKWKIFKFAGFNAQFLESVRFYFNYHPITTSKLWNSNIRQSNIFRNNPRFVTLKFEDFILRPEKHLQQLCKTIEIEFEPSMLDVITVSTSYNTDLGRKGFNKDKVDSWKRSNLTSTEIHLCQRISNLEMRQFGYKTVKIKKNYILIFLSILGFPFKLIVALVLNLKRNRNLFRVIKTRLMK